MGNDASLHSYLLLLSNYYYEATNEYEFIVISDFNKRIEDFYLCSCIVLLIHQRDISRLQMDTIPTSTSTQVEGRRRDEVHTHKIIRELK